MTGRNYLKTTLLLAGLSGLLLAIGSFLGGNWITIMLVVAIAMNGVAYFFSDKIAIRAAGAVLDPGVTERAVYLPRGRWIDLWRSVRYRDGNGSLRLRRAKVLRGAGEATVPAPLEELQPDASEEHHHQHAHA